MTAKNLEQGVATFKADQAEAAKALRRAAHQYHAAKSTMTEAGLYLAAIEFVARLKGAAS